MRKPLLLRTLIFGLRKKCPRCGVGNLFQSWFVLCDRCSGCGCPFQRREDDTYFFMYLSTGFVTGLLIIGMFWVVPQNIRVGQWALLGLSLVVFVLTHPYRKGLAVALDFYVDSHSEFPKFPSSLDEP